MDHLRPDALTPGVVDEAAYAAFTHGTCEAFAVAIHDITGWPLVKVTDPHNVHGDPDRHGIAAAGGGSGVHWAVLAPDGRLVDIRGAHQPAELAAEYDDYVDELTDGDETDGYTPGAKLGYGTRGDAIDESSTKSGTVAVEHAAAFVRPALEEAGYSVAP